MAAHLTKTQRFWLTHIRACESARMSPAAYCKKHGLITQRLYGYRSDLRKRGIRFSGDLPSSKFTSVVKREELNAVPKPAGIRWHCQLSFDNRFFNLKLCLGQPLP